MAQPERLERSTPTSEVLCSIQLSYGCTKMRSDNINNNRKNLTTLFCTSSAHKQTSIFHQPSFADKNPTQKNPKKTQLISKWLVRVNKLWAGLINFDIYKNQLILGIYNNFCCNFKPLSQPPTLRLRIRGLRVRILPDAPTMGSSQA